MPDRRPNVLARRLGQRHRAPKKTHVPDDIQFLTKPQIALVLIDEAIADGITVKAWTFDELYGRDGKFLDGLDERKQPFVGEVPPNFYAWTGKPKVLRKPSKNLKGRRKKYPRLPARDAKACQVQNLAKYSPGLASQAPQRYRTRDSHKGPEIWEVRWHVVYRKTHDGRLVSSQCTLIVAKNIRTGEVKYFIGNRVPGRDGWTVRELLRIAFGRWKVEACFREAKEELGWDHFECRGWACVHRHMIVTIVSQLFCARVRHRLCRGEVVTDAERLTLEQVRRAADVVIRCIGLPKRLRNEQYEAESRRISYHQRRNAAASRCHRKKRIADYHDLGIDPDQIKRVEPKSP
ncbi:SRSO17 transposase [Rhodopirellula rubra]|uniref:SRSO17 transposase n=1 Tax=Aporhodopirellula rubra TaxID=980271 RepID=A0A7W5DXV7_9BACT|nr:transposase [Aporhodopirellula rubra]MBB3206536.1 SRSO17 transposase [Aporhodopirellula rubra]